MRILTWFTIVVVCSVSVSAQATSSTLSVAQKSLKKLLDKDAPYVAGVKFDGCRVSIRSVDQQPYWSATRSSGMTTGMLLRDDSSNYLSGGGDQLIFEGRSTVYEFDLTKLDSSKLLVGRVWKRDLTSITIADQPNGAMVAKKPDEMLDRFRPGTYVIVTKKKSAEKTVQALRNVALACSADSK